MCGVQRSCISTRLHGLNLIMLLVVYRVEPVGAVRSMMPCGVVSDDSARCPSFGACRDDVGVVGCRTHDSRVVGVLDLAGGRSVGDHCVHAVAVCGESTREEGSGVRSICLQDPVESSTWIFPPVHLWFVDTWEPVGALVAQQRTCRSFRRGVGPPWIQWGEPCGGVKSTLNR